MIKKGNIVYNFTIITSIIVTLVMGSAFVLIEDINLRLLLSSWIPLIIIYTIHFASSKLIIEEDISHNSIIVFKSFFGVNSLYLNHINKVVFIKRKNFFVKNTIYLYNNMGEFLILDGNNRNYHKLLKEVMDKIKNNKGIIIDEEIFRFLKFSDLTMNQIKDKNYELSSLKEKIMEDKSYPQDNINSNLIKWVLISVFSPSLIFTGIQIIVKFIIPTAIAIYLIITDLI